PRPTPSEPDVKPSVDGGQDAAEEVVGPPDDELVVRCQAGDTRAFDELVTRYRGRVYGMIYNMVKSEADAWDLSQEAFIKAWKALPKFEARSSFYTWL
ncbi:MAG: RNA polymerase sigma factor, partial [Verrucomicrobiales bacterium]